MKTDSLKEVLSALLKAKADSSKPKDVLIVTHERPDGDAIGSSAGLCSLLNENGFKAEVYLPGENAVPDSYLRYAQPYQKAVENFPAWLEENFSLLVNVDASTVKRMNLGGADFHALKTPSLTIDHHPDDELFAARNYIDATACATAQIVFELAETANWRVSPESATKLLLGITTDSGCFRFDNTNPAALRAAAALIELKADHHGIIESVYLAKPLNMARFEAEMLCSHLQSAFDGKFLWLSLDPAVMASYSVELRNTETLIEVIRSIAGVEIAALIKPPNADHGYKISLRSKNPAYSVGRIARELNGGGHEMAAGGTIFAPTLEEAQKILLQHVEKELKK